MRVKWPLYLPLPCQYARLPMLLPVRCRVPSAIQFIVLDSEDTCQLNTKSSLEAVEEVKQRDLSTELDQRIKLISLAHRLK
jgi:hypothetical protein